MTLDLVKVAEQLPLLVERLQRERTERERRLACALDRLRQAAASPERFEERVLSADCSWPLALVRQGAIDGSYPAPEAPCNYAALAVDGSSIDVDRQEPIDCYVLNFGWMALRYGAGAVAEPGSGVTLEPTGGPLRFRDADDPSRESAVAGNLLSVVRSVRELAMLAELADRYASDSHPLLALVDGNLALWNLDKPDVPRSVADELKQGERGIVPALNRLRDLALAGRVLFSGYVSRTGASNVVNSLRLLACPLEERVVCRRCPGKETGTRPCDEAGLAKDAELMLHVLRPWERSAVFAQHRAHQAGTAERWYEAEGHEILFFYLRVAEDEIARIELPAWMAEDADRLGRLHALLVAQARAGPDYPLALQEAHEQAVISTADRRSFSALIARE
ncbi:MAG TPA: DNA double-strand break repair nuclease NurA, partial [Dehalococcoidia bacterium]|nr:DNA double-strand break repair nuclease NurA [Dehalococcoidia bacterium]